MAFIGSLSQQLTAGPGIAASSLLFANAGVGQLDEQAADNGIKNVASVVSPWAHTNGYTGIGSTAANTVIFSNSGQMVYSPPTVNDYNGSPQIVSKCHFTIVPSVSSTGVLYMRADGSFIDPVLGERPIKATFAAITPDYRQYVSEMSDRSAGISVMTMTAQLWKSGEIMGYRTYTPLNPISTAGAMIAESDITASNVDARDLIAGVPVSGTDTRMTVVYRKSDGGTQLQPFHTTYQTSGGAGFSGTQTRYGVNNATSNMARLTGTQGDALFSTTFEGALRDATGSTLTLAQVEAASGWVTYTKSTPGAVPVIGRDWVTVTSAGVSETVLFNAVVNTDPVEGAMETLLSSNTSGYTGILFNVPINQYDYDELSGADMALFVPISTGSGTPAPLTPFVATRLLWDSSKITNTNVVPQRCIGGTIDIDIPGGTVCASIDSSIAPGLSLFYSYDVYAKLTDIDGITQRVTPPISGVYSASGVGFSNDPDGVNIAAGPISGNVAGISVKGLSMYPVVDAMLGKAGAEPPIFIGKIEVFIRITGSYGVGSAMIPAGVDGYTKPCVRHRILGSTLTCNWDTGRGMDDPMCIGVLVSGITTAAAWNVNVGYAGVGRLRPSYAPMSKTAEHIASNPLLGPALGVLARALPGVYSGMDALQFMEMVGGPLGAAAVMALTENSAADGDEEPSNSITPMNKLIALSKEHTRDSSGQQLGAAVSTLSHTPEGKAAMAVGKNMLTNALGKQGASAAISVGKDLLGMLDKKKKKPKKTYTPASADE